MEQLFKSSGAADMIITEWTESSHLFRAWIILLFMFMFIRPSYPRNDLFHEVQRLPDYFRAAFSLSRTMLCIVYKLEQGFAWRSEVAGGGAGWAESTTWPQEPNIASFIHVCNQRNQEWEKYYPRGHFGWNFTGNRGWQCSFLCLYSKRIRF